jgi:hypothetical protein
MKRIALTTLMLSLSLFMFACTSEGPTIPEEGENPHVQSQEEGIATEVESIPLEELARTQNEMFATMNTDEMAMLVSAEGTVLTYTYQFFNMEIYRERGQDYFADAVAEGQLLFQASLERAPEMTLMLIEFVDNQGEVLKREEFRP